MKKWLLILLILFLGLGSYILYDIYFNEKVPKLTIEDELVAVDLLYIYGNHFNLHSDFVTNNDTDIVLYNGEFLEYKINQTNDGFNLSDSINNGINLESIPRGTYYVFLRNTQIDQDNNSIVKYYALNNTTDYNKTIYYTFSNVNNKITISTDDKYNSLVFDVKKSNDPNIYDVVVDAGHGGIDTGANYKGRVEADYNIKIATALKNKLESYGIKVKMTREENSLASDEKMADYGVHGRAVINHEVFAKYVFSIHLNSSNYSSVSGIEIYTPANIDYTFVSSLANNIVNATGSHYSNNKINRLYNGVYTRVFSEKDISSSIKESESTDKIPYDIEVNDNYYFMTRETGGIMTGAYVDDRNAPKLPGNPYYNSNIGSESYLLELAYLTNDEDFYNLDNNFESYADAIANSFKKVFDGE